MSKKADLPLNENEPSKKPKAKKAPKQAKEPKKRGRPSKYTKALAQEIFETIATHTCSIKTLCREREHWPAAKNLFAWTTTNEEFRNLYLEAKRLQALWIAEEMFDIADDSSEDELMDDNGNIRPNNEFIQRSRLRVELRKWHVARLQPKVYGDARLAEEERDKNDHLRLELLKLKAELEEAYKRDY